MTGWQLTSTLRWLAGKPRCPPCRLPLVPPAWTCPRSWTGPVTSRHVRPRVREHGVCTSAITYIDGDAGILRYRGYPIEQLAESSSSLEVSYLLIHGELPTAEQFADFTGQLTAHTMLREEMRRFFDGFPRDAHPMSDSFSVNATRRSVRAPRSTSQQRR